jgi:hypothetical protein
MILQSIPNIIVDIREILFIGLNTSLNEMKSLINYSPSSNKSEKLSSLTFSLTAFDIVQFIIDAGNERKTSRRSPSGSSSSRLIVSKPDQYSTLWAGIELKVPENFQWGKQTDFTRFFIIFHKKISGGYQASSSTASSSSTSSFSSSSSLSSLSILPPTPSLSSSPSIPSSSSITLSPFDYDILSGATNQIEIKVTLTWKLEQRKKGFRETLKNLESILLESRNASLNEIYQIFLTNIPKKWLRADIYIGFLKSGCQAIEYIACNDNSKMLGKVLKRGEGISFDVIDNSQTLIFSNTDLDKKKQLNEGSLIGILYGKKQYTGKLIKFRGHDKMDVRYDCDQKIEAGVDITRVIPMNIAFRIKLFPKAKLPFICIPIKNRSKTFGILGVDNIDEECLLVEKEGLAVGEKGELIVDDDLKIFLEQLGKILGSYIDLKIKKNALYSLYMIAKNQNTEVKDLFTASVDLLFSCSCFISGVIVSELIDPVAFSVLPSASLTIISKQGNCHGDLLSKISMFDVKKYFGSSSNNLSGKKFLHKIGPKSVLLLCYIKSDDDTAPQDAEEPRLYVIGISSSCPIHDVDYEFFNALQKTLAGLLHNVITHKASGEFRAKALKDIRQLCHTWNLSLSSSSASTFSPFSTSSSFSLTSSSFFRQSFFDQFCERIWKCYHSANLYVGILGMHNNSIKYILASNASHMKGKMLIRSNEQSVSFIAVDKDKPLCILAGTNLANSLYHFGEKQSFQFPFVIVPIVAELDSVFGILGVDNSASEGMIADSSSGAGGSQTGQLDDLLSFYGTVGLSLGKVIRRFRTEDVKLALKEISVKSDSFHEAITAIRKILLEFLPFSTRIIDLSFRPFISKAVLPKELVVFMQVTEFHISTSPQPSSSLLLVPSYRLAVMSRGQIIGEIRTGNRSSSVECVLKLLVSEGVSTENVKLLFKAYQVFDLPSSSTNKNTTSSAPRTIEKEICQKVLTLHYFLHAPLLPHLHSFLSPPSDNIKQRAEIGSFQLVSRVEEANESIALFLSSLVLRLEFSSSITKIKLEYQIYCLVSWNGSVLGRTEYDVLETRIEWNDLETFLPLHRNSSNPVSSLLEIEIWSCAQKIKDDLLGKITFSYSKLLSVLSPSIPSSSSSSSAASYQVIQRNTECLSFITNLSMKLGGSLIPAKSLEDDKILNILKRKDHSEISSLIPFQIQKSVKNLDNFLQCEVSVLQVKDLVLNEKLESSSMATYISLHLNNAEIGTTSICYDTNVIHWNDEFFRILVPIGPDWEELVLSFTLFGLLGNATSGAEPLLIGKLVLKSKKLAEFLLSGLYKEKWFDLDLFNSEIFVLEGNNQLFSPSILLSGRVLTASKPLISRPATAALDVHEDRYLMDFLGFQNIPSLFFDNGVCNFIHGYYEGRKFLDLKYALASSSSSGGWGGKIKRFPLLKGKSLQDSVVVLEFHRKVKAPLRASFIAATETSILLDRIEVKGRELAHCLKAGNCLVNRWFPIPSSIYPDGQGIIKFLSGLSDSPTLYEYDDFMVVLCIHGIKSLPVEMRTRLLTTNEGKNDLRPNVACRVYWNNQFVNQTNVIRNASSPVWNTSEESQQFLLRVPVDFLATQEERVGKCLLVVEVVSVPIDNAVESFTDSTEGEKNEVICRLKLTGSELVQCFFQKMKRPEIDEAFNGKRKKTEAYSDDRNITLFPWLPLSSELIPFEEDYDAKEQLTPMIQVFGAIAESGSSLKGTTPVDSLHREFMVQIIKAENLANTDAFGSANAYVELLVDGKVIGFTQTITNTMDPVYDNEVFFLDLFKMNSSFETLQLQAWSLFPSKPRAFLGEVALTIEEVLVIVRDLSSSSSSSLVFSRDLSENMEFTEEENAFVQGSLSFQFKILQYHTKDVETVLYDSAILQIISVSNLPKSSLLNTIPTFYFRVLRRNLLEGSELVEIYRSNGLKTAFSLNYEMEEHEGTDGFIPVRIPVKRSHWKDFRLVIEFCNEFDELIASLTLRDNDACELLNRKENECGTASRYTLLLNEKYVLLDSETSNNCEVSLRGGKQQYLDTMKMAKLSKSESSFTESENVENKISLRVREIELIGNRPAPKLPLPSSSVSSRFFSSKSTMDVAASRTASSSPSSSSYWFVIKNKITHEVLCKSVLDMDIDAETVPELTFSSLFVDQNTYDWLLYPGSKDKELSDDLGAVVPVARIVFDCSSFTESTSKYEEFELPLSSLLSVEKEIGNMKILRIARPTTAPADTNGDIFSLMSEVKNDQLLNQEEVIQMPFEIEILSLKIIAKPAAAVKSTNLYVTLSWVVDSRDVSSQILGQTASLKESVVFNFDCERFQTEGFSSSASLLFQVFNKNQLSGDILVAAVTVSAVTIKEMFQDTKQKTDSFVAVMKSKNSFDQFGWERVELQLAFLQIPDVLTSPVFNPSLPLPRSCEEVELTIYGFSNLNKIAGGMMSMGNANPDPFCVVTYGYSNLGESTVINDTVNPLWFDNQSFGFRFPVSRRGEGEDIFDSDEFDYCNLYVDVFSYNKSSTKHVYLGSAVLTAEEILRSLKEGDGDEDIESSKQCFQLKRSLQKSDRKKVSESKTVSTNGTCYFSISRREVIGSSFEGKDIDVTILSAKGLDRLFSTSTAVGGSGVYCVVRWNGKIVGLTSSIKLLSQQALVWENEKFNVHLPDIDLLKDCFLHVELWHSKINASSSVANANDHKKDFLLGVIVLTGTELVGTFNEGRYGSSKLMD